jgi:CO/xanthine dehydrogenase FAD-binding subunit
MKDFTYHRASTVKEALALLRKGKDSIRPLAGGTDLLVQWKSGKRPLSGVVDIKSLGALSGIKQTKTAVTIGSCTRLAEILASRVLARKLPLLHAVAAQMGSPQVRNRATLGGNLANAAPSADMAPPLMALDAKVQIVTPRGRKTVPLAGFFLGPGETLLGKDGLLSAITIPVPKKGTKAAYYPLTLREAMDISIVSAAAAVRKEKKKVVHARIVLGAVAPVPLRAVKAEKALLGSDGGPDAILRAAKEAAKEARPITDQRGTKTYRREMVEVAVERALSEVLS